MSVVLDVTGDLLLTGSDIFGSLYLDQRGAIALEHEELRNIIAQLAKAINQQHDQVQNLQTEVDALHGERHAAKQSTLDIERRLQEVEDTGREVKITMIELKESMQALAEAAGKDRQDRQELDVVKKDDIVALEERFQELAEQLEQYEQLQKQSAARLIDDARETRERLQRHEDIITKDLDTRFIKCDDALLVQKLDLEGLQVSLTDLQSRKANKSDVTELQKKLDVVRQEQTKDSAVLKEAHSNLEKLDDCVNLATDNKTQTQELWRIFREESQEVRDWASRAFNELRSTTRKKIDETTALHHIDELRTELRKNTAHLSQVTARVEAGFRHKADSGDLIRLEDTVEEFKKLNKKARQMLVGTKCLSCDRAAADEVTMDGAVDVAKERQQEQLFHEVQRILSKETGGVGQDVLKFVAVHVGSPTRLPSAGVGTFEARNVLDHTPGSHHLVPAGGGARSAASSRPSTHGLRFRNPSAPESERSPARVPAPLVRMAPRRLWNDQEKKAATLRGQMATVRDVLGPNYAAHRQHQAEEGRADEMAGTPTSF